MGCGGGRLDAIVIGSGVAGLTTAALLAHEAHDVLLVEAGAAAGGYGHAFRRGDHVFDPAIHLIPEAAYVRNLLDYLGAGHEVTFEPAETLYTASFPFGSLTVPHEPGDRDAYVDAHMRAFPAEAGAFRELFDVFERVFYEATSLPFRVFTEELGDLESRFPTLVRYRMATVQDVLDEYLHDEQLKAVVSAPWSYLGLPPSRLSFLLFAQMTNVMASGAYHVAGGFQPVVDALVESFARHGGELRTGVPVERILVDDGRVTGVRLADGTEAFAPVVVSGADGRHTLEDLVGVDQLPAQVARKLRRLKPSLSAFLLFAGTSYDFAAVGGTYENFLFEHVSHDDTYGDIVAGRPGGMSIAVPTLADPSLAPAGSHAVVVRALAPFDAGAPWSELKDAYTEQLLSLCEARFPGFRDSLEFVEASTPEALRRFTRNSDGACYGWENSPAQAGSRRLPHQPGIDGLYLTGHWTEEGTGCLRAVFSGATVANEVLAAAGADRPVPDFRPRAMGAPMRDKAQKKALVRRFFEEVWNKGNFEFIDEYYSDDFTLHALWQNTALGGSGEASGKEAAKDVIARWREAFPDVHISVEDQVVEGDMVTSHHVFSGTNDRPFQGIPPTGRHGAIHGMTMTRVVDGKITDAWTMWDVVSLIGQLGLAQDPMEPERNKTVVRRLYDDVWNGERYDVTADLVAPEFTGRAAADHTLAGAEDLNAFVQMWRGGLEGMHVEVEAMYAEEDRIATRFRITGTHTSSLLGVAATGRDVSVAGMAITHVADGRIVSDWCEVDLLGMFQQLGAVPTGTPPPVTGNGGVATAKATS